jgi:hypothetical protein
MRIAYDHGMGAKLTGIGSRRDNVLVVHIGEGARNYRSEKGIPSNDESKDVLTGSVDGIRIPGTDLNITTSDAAKTRDAEVRGHERAHLMSAGSAAASGVHLVLRRGPDGQSYAVGGLVKVDMSPVPGDPEATIRKARNIMNASNAPGNPSAADMRVAAEAYRMAAAARREIHSTDILA